MLKNLVKPKNTHSNGVSGVPGMGKIIEKVKTIKDKYLERMD